MVIKILELESVVMDPQVGGLTHLQLGGLDGAVCGVGWWLVGIQRNDGCGIAKSFTVNETLLGAIVADDKNNNNKITKQNTSGSVKLPALVAGSIPRVASTNIPRVADTRT